MRMAANLNSTARFQRDSQPGNGCNDTLVHVPMRKHAYIVTYLYAPPDRWIYAHCQGCRNVNIYVPGCNLGSTDLKTMSNELDT